METFLKDKKLNIAVFILIIIVSLFVVAKFVNEVKLSSYIGHESQSANVISVSGFGEVNAISDIASLNVYLTKDGVTAKEAQDLLNETISKTLAYLKDQKIEDKDIKSEYGGLSPKYSYDQPVCFSYPCPSHDPKIVGYTATQSVTIKIRKVDDANNIKTGLASLGITDINGPTFSIDDEELFKTEARSIAINEAKEKAKILADDLGVKLGRIISFGESGDSMYPMYNAKAMMSSDMMEVSAPAPVLPKGENKIISNITITYEIK